MLNNYLKVIGKILSKIRKEYKENIRSIKLTHNIL